MGFNPIVIEKGLSARFAQAMMEFQAARELAPGLMMAALAAPSTGAYEKYGWLGSMPSVQQWIGERNSKELANYDYTIRNKDWEASVLETVRGEGAWLMVEDANMFNDPPEEGMEYITVKFRVRHIGTGEGYESIDGSFFNSTGERRFHVSGASSASVSISIAPGMCPADSGFLRQNY